MTTTKIFSTTLRIAIAASALAGGVAEAKPRRVVIQDFDGPRKLVDSSHAAVVSILGAEFDLVSTKSWDDAKSNAGRVKHGPQVWLIAARKSGADAIVEGYINDEGRKHMLTLIVREATTGNEVDQVSIRMPDSGVNAATEHQLKTSLDAVLDWIEPQYNGENHSLEKAQPRKMIGAKADEGEARVKSHSDDDTDEQPVKKSRSRRAADDDTDDQPVKKTRTRTTSDDDDVDSTPAPRKRHKVSVLGDDDTAPVDKKIVVGTAEPAEPSGGKVLIDLLPPPSDVVAADVEIHQKSRPTPTPRYQLSLGLYRTSRQMEFTAGDQTGPMEYNGTAVSGVQVAASVYPFPKDKMDGRPSGPGFSLLLGHSIGSVYTFDDGDTTADYTIDQSVFEAGLHYRWNVSELAGIDVHASYGKSSHIINDAPEELEVPDVSYEWLGVGADVELNVTKRTTLSAGFSYQYMLDQGDLTSEDWYGSGHASGLDIHAGFKVPLPYDMYVGGTVNYRKVTTEFNGDGVLTQMWGVTESADTSLGFGVDVGVQF